MLKMLIADFGLPIWMIGDFGFEIADC